MIAGCTQCGARYRIDPAKLGPEGARLRCTRCETVFRVRPPAAEESPVAATRESGFSEAGRGVLVAHSDPAQGKRIAEALGARGLETSVVHDGVEAILQIQRHLPRVVILDAALPKMFGFQVCEIVKRNEQLRSIAVLLVGAIHDQERYRRNPEELYGADAYVESHELPDGIFEHLARLGRERGAATRGAKPSAPTPAAPQAKASEGAKATPAAPAKAESAATAPAPSAPAAEAQLGNDDPAFAEGRRLARIIVSDVILYNQEKFDAALASGASVSEALHSDLEEGYALFAQRIDPKVCDPKEFLQRELERVAAEKRG